ncbi:ankyrin repeat-containing domain protein, partial [Cadophora sp. MPI-SDFR-AT-0126]
EIVRLLLKREPDIVGKDEDWGQMLWEAVRGGHEDMVQYLLDQGAIIDATPKKGEAALGYAAELGKESITRLLLDRGAKPNPPGHSYDIDTGYSGAALFRAAGNGHESIVRLLLDRGALIDGKGYIGMSPLQLAASRGHLAIVRLLLDRGANVNATSSTGSTALMDAAFNGRPEIVRLLLDHGADADMKTKSTAMSYAKEKHHDDVVRVLKSYRSGLRKLW